MRPSSIIADAAAGATFGVGTGQKLFLLAKKVHMLTYC